MTLGDFVEEFLGHRPADTDVDGANLAESNLSHKPPYVFDSQVLQQHPSLLDGVSLPDFVTTNVTLQQTAVGPPLSGAAPHFHPPAWNALVFGRKVWILLPPRIARFLAHHSAIGWFRSLTKNRLIEMLGGPNDPKPLLAVQEAGDLVYIPPFWGHAVLNTADSFAFAMEGFA